MILKGEYKGRLGNHLFNYLVRLLYSKRRGLYLPPGNFSWFRNTYFPYGNEQSPNEKTIIYKKTRIFESPETVFRDFDNIASDTDIEISQNLGFNYNEWVLPNFSFVKELYRYEEPKIDIDFDNTTIINIRQGDFKYHKKVISFDFYKEEINKIDNKKLIITDEPELDYIKSLNCDVYPIDEPIHHFTILKNCKRIIGSNSTFFFWAMYLNENIESCIWPVTTNGSYAAFSLTKILKHNMDIRVDRKGFEYVYDVPYFERGDNTEYGILEQSKEIINNFHKESAFRIFKGKNK